MIRFQYEPYARRVPAVTAAENDRDVLGEGGQHRPLARGRRADPQAASPSARGSATQHRRPPAGTHPSRRCQVRSSRLASFSARERHVCPESLIHHRERVSGQRVLTGPGHQRTRSPVRSPRRRRSTAAITRSATRPDASIRPIPWTTSPCQRPVGQRQKRRPLSFPGCHARGALGNARGDERGGDRTRSPGCLCRACYLGDPTSFCVRGLEPPRR